MTDHTIALIGCSSAIRLLDQEITSAARSDAKILITGESGVGKEVTARLVHLRSARRQMPLLALNCAGVPDSLLESELFGHVRGSFTGAYRDKPGLFEAANGGTVFLDEVGEMSLRMQALLLRFLETGEIQRVGSEKPPVRLDVRLICATNRNLSERIASGDFREDLYYRLHVVHLHIGPLRERSDDVPVLIDHFVTLFAERHRVPTPLVAADVRDRLCAYAWPGNVRELKNVIERLVVRAANGVIVPADLPPEIRRVIREAPPTADAPPAEALADTIARDLYRRLTQNGETFWNVVYAPFMTRDLTRDTVRRVVTFGLEEVGGRYSALTELYGMGKDDYKRFLNFLRKYDCLVAHHAFRTSRGDTRTAASKPGDSREAVA